MTVYDYIGKQSRSWPCKITRSGIFTTYHLEIPWSATNIGKPAKGKAFAMNFAFFDVIRPDGKQADFCITLTEGLTGGQNDSKFKTFILE